MSVHKHAFAPIERDHDLGPAMYECGCGTLGRRSLATGRIDVVPFKRPPEAPTVGLKDQPQRQDYAFDMIKPRKVHRSTPSVLGLGEGRAFQPSPTYRRVCVAMLELGSDRPLETLAEMAGCSVAFVRKVQAHVMADV